MTQSASDTRQDDAPLISARFIVRLAIVVVVLVGVTIAIGLGGHRLGERMALGGHTESDALYRVTIGDDTLVIPANVIRFDEQRRTGAADRVDLYLTWPGLHGYSPELREYFDDVERPESLIFLQVSQSTMSKDMSGRLQPIYTQLFDGSPQPFTHGLTLNRLRADSGYGNEVVLTATAKGGSPYVVRCVLPAASQKATGADCQRDIHLGSDLTVLYRFSSTILKDWDHIDAAVRSFVQSRLDGADGVTGVKIK